MTPEAERDYRKALRRIKEAEENKSVELDLGGLENLSSFPPELASLTSLQSLNLTRCTQLSDLRPLAALTSLQSLNLSMCEQLSGDLTPLAGLTSLQRLLVAGCKLSGDLSPLAELKSLQSVNLSKCIGIRRFSPLESLLPTLHALYLYGCNSWTSLRESAAQAARKMSSIKSAFSMEKTSIK